MDEVQNLSADERDTLSSKNYGTKTPELSELDVEENSDIREKNGRQWLSFKILYPSPNRMIKPGQTTGVGLVADIKRWHMCTRFKKASWTTLGVDGRIFKSILKKHHCKYTSQDREKWWAVVKVVMNLQVAWKSRRTLSPLAALERLCPSVELPNTNRMKSSLQRNIYFVCRWCETRKTQNSECITRVMLHIDHSRTRSYTHAIWMLFWRYRKGISGWDWKQYDDKNIYKT